MSRPRGTGWCSGRHRSAGLGSIVRTITGRERDHFVGCGPFRERRRIGARRTLWRLTRRRTRFCGGRGDDDERRRGRVISRASDDCPRARGSPRQEKRPEENTRGLQRPAGFRYKRLSVVVFDVASLTQEGGMGGRRLHPLDLRSLSTDMDSPDEPSVELSRFKTRALCQSVSIAMRLFRNQRTSA